MLSNGFNLQEHGGRVGFLGQCFKSHMIKSNVTVFAIGMYHNVL